MTESLLTRSADGQDLVDERGVAPDQRRTTDAEFAERDAPDEARHDQAPVAEPHARPEAERRSGESRAKVSNDRAAEPDEAGDARPHDVLDLGQGHLDEGGEGADGPSDDQRRMPSRWVFVGVALVLAGLLAWGVYGHWRRSADADATQRAASSSVPSVRTIVAQSDDRPVDLTLPGETQAFDSASIYARATGYIAERRVDIGSRVRAGDLLVHIAAPDLDEQLAQAVAQLGQVKAAEAQAQAQVSQAEANLNLAKVTLGRTNALVGQGFETLQNRDTQQANLASQQANLDTARAGVKLAAANTAAQQANVDRLRALTAFEDVKAPFDGVVTSRNTDLGALINADSAGGSPLFVLARDDILRVIVQVPQNAAVGVREGLEAKIRVPQLPGRTFEGRVTRSSVALQTSARTLTVEVDVPNATNVLRAGLYAYVSFAVPRVHPVVVLPAETLVFNQSGLQVAVAGENDQVRMTPVTIGQDFGTTVEIVDGLKGGERIILNPPAILRDGLKVKVDEPKPAQGEPPPAQQRT